MLHTDRLVIVEGKYDKIKLEQVLDALILPTDGFSIFKDKSKTDFIKKYARENGVLILTDSDAAGFKIRNHIASILPAETIINAYIPDIKGKEKRKSAYSAEGKLGVEGMEHAVLKEALKRAGIDEMKVAENHTKSYDLYRYGFLGSENSSVLRGKLIQALSLPERISTNNLLKYINRNFNKSEFETLAEKIVEENNVSTIS